MARAHERGMAPVRRVPVALCGVLGGALGAWAADLPQTLVALLRQQLALGADSARVPLDAGAPLVETVVTVLAVSWPVFAGGLLGVTVGTMAQTGGVLSWSRPRTGMAARVASMSGPGAWGRAASGVVWVVAAGGAAGAAVAAQWPLVASLPHAPLLHAVEGAGRVAVGAALAAFTALALLGVADTLLARARWRAQLAMTPEEAREEQRNNDGDPLVRRRRSHAARRSIRALVDRRTSADSAMQRKGGTA